jgi:uncharacterized protein YceK
MKKITAVLIVMLITGCTGMGMDSSPTSGRSDMRAGQMSSMGNHSVIDDNGQLTLHHGG